jgi:hypothetical protein
MELSELEPRLIRFARAKYADDAVEVSQVHKMPGHADFAYGFSVTSRGRMESWFLRIPPPNVQWQGTADVMRQVTVLRALDGTDVPHCISSGRAPSSNGSTARTSSCRGSRGTCCGSATASGVASCPRRRSRSG